VDAGKIEITASWSTKTQSDKEHETCPQAPESLTIIGGLELSEQSTSSVAIVKKSRGRRVLLRMDACR
jgi:hypothetical protein